MAAHVRQRIARALRVQPVCSTLDLVSWVYPREVGCRDRYRRKNMARAIRRAAEAIGAMCVGRVWPGGNLWRAGNSG